jgi:hypothetical protein
MLCAELLHPNSQGGCLNLLYSIPNTYVALSINKKATSGWSLGRTTSTHPTLTSVRLQQRRKSLVLVVVAARAKLPTYGRKHTRICSAIQVPLSPGPTKARGKIIHRVEPLFVIKRKTGRKRAFGESRRPCRIVHVIDLAAPLLTQQHIQVSMDIV